MKKIKWNSVPTVFFCGAVLGAAAFLLGFGWRVLDPQRIGWLLNRGDPTQHFLGWTAFRISPWKFPLCLTDMLSFPYDALIVFTDSIPLFALPFKLFRIFLPEQFQYFGFFGLCCFLLQGGFAALLVRRFTNRLLPCLLGALFFLFVPALFFRMFYHTSLAAQWTILAGMAIWLYSRPGNSLYRILFQWILLGCVTIAIHPFLAAMVCGLFVGQMAQIAVHDRKVRQALAGIAVYALVLAVFFFVIGGFHGVSEGAGKFGSFSANLNTFYNPMQSNTLLKQQPVLQGQYEGQAFLGAGMLVTVLFALFLRITRRHSAFRRLAPRGFLPPFLAVCAIFFLYALSIKVTWNDEVLFTLPVPEFVIHLCNIFRASGRFMWVPMYALMLFAIGIVLRETPPRRRVAVLLAVLMLQGFDLYPMVRESFERFRDPAVDPIPDPARTQFMKALPDKIRLFAFVQGSEYDALEPGYFLLKNGIPLSDFYFSRPEPRTQTTRREIRRMLDENRRLPDHVLYLFRARHLVGRSGLFCYEFGDGMIAGSTVPVPGFTPLPPAPDAESIFVPAVRLEPEQPRVRFDLSPGEKTGTTGIPLRAGHYRFIVRGINPGSLRAEIDDMEIPLKSADSGAAEGEFTLSVSHPEAELRLQAADHPVSLFQIELRPLPDRKTREEIKKQE